jgi:hypothetical protein
MIFTAPLDRLEGLFYFAARVGGRQLLTVRCGARAREAILGLVPPAPSRPLRAETFAGLAEALREAFPDVGVPARGAGVPAQRRPASPPSLSADVPAPSHAPEGSVFFGPARNRWSLLERLFPGHLSFALALELPLDPRGLWFPTRHTSPQGGRVTREEHLYVAASPDEVPGEAGVAPPRRAAFQRGLPHRALGPELGADQVLWSMTLSGPRPDADTWVELAPMSPLLGGARTR